MLTKLGCEQKDCVYDKDTCQNFDDGCCQLQSDK